MIERGYHSLFFPGEHVPEVAGLRGVSSWASRGLGLRPLSELLQREGHGVWSSVPSTINYMLTLEAETLIDDKLAKEQGKSRYIIDDNESTRWGKMAGFVRNLAMREESCMVRFGYPVDPFGNEVDEEGQSHDARGRSYDPTTYITRSEKPVLDGPRDAQYTRVIGRRDYLRLHAGHHCHADTRCRRGGLFATSGPVTRTGFLLP